MSKYDFQLQTRPGGKTVAVTVVGPGLGSCQHASGCAPARAAGAGRAHGPPRRIIGRASDWPVAVPAARPVHVRTCQADIGDTVYVTIGCKGTATSRPGDSARLTRKPDSELTREPDSELELLDGKCKWQFVVSSVSSFSPCPFA